MNPFFAAQERRREKREYIKKPKGEEQMLEEIREDIIKEKEKSEKMRGEITDLQAQREALGVRSAIGMKVQHRNFGTGEVFAEEDKYAEVRFASVEKRFDLSDAISDGLLKIEDEEARNYYNKVEELHKEVEQLVLELRSADFMIKQMQAYVKRLEKEKKIAK